MASGNNDKLEIMNNEGGTDSIKDEAGEESLHEKNNQEDIRAEVKLASGKNDKPEFLNDGADPIEDECDESLHDEDVKHNHEKIRTEVKMASGENGKSKIKNVDGTDSIKDDLRDERFHELQVKPDEETSPVEFKRESGKNDPKIINNEDCAGYIEDYPREETLHELFEKLNPDNNPGSPVEIENCEPGFTIQSGCVTAHGIGLTNGIAGEPCKFTIYEKSSGDDLAVCVKGPSVAEIKCHNNKDNTISVTYLPAASGVYKIKVESLGKGIPGSPFKAKVTGFLIKLSHFKPFVNPTMNESRSLTKREAPESEAVKLNDMRGSPFKNYDDTIESSIYKSEVGAGLKRGVIGEPASFTIYKQGAGGYELAVAVKGPSIAEIKCCENNDGTISVQYLPTAVGEYTIMLRFHGKDITNETFKAQITGNRPKDVNAHVQSPSGIVEDSSISNLGNFLYRLVFIPQEMGVYTISVHCLDRYTTKIPGSPFLFSVGPYRTRGANRVHAGGPGLIGGNSNEPCEFHVWTREAGAGSLEIYVEGISKADIEFKGFKDESCCISYKVPEPGDYRIGITFNYHHIPYSPFNVLILPSDLDVQSIGFFTKRAPSNCTVSKKDTPPCCQKE